jgi:hypothetical protein
VAATETETRQLESFTAISLDGIGTVRFIQDETSQCTIEAEPNAFALIRLDVEKGVLHIHTTFRSAKVISFKSMPTYSVSGPELRKLTLNGAGRAEISRLIAPLLEVSVDGAGDIRMKDQTLEMCRITIAGAGNVKASGTATNQEISIAGTGNFSGETLVGETVRVDISGAGRAKVHATKDLTAEIGGVGQISYIGDPRVKSHVGGLGRIKKDQ